MLPPSPVEITAGPAGTPAFEFQHRAGWQNPHTAKQRPFAKGAPAREKLGEALSVKAPRLRSCGEDGFRFGSEQEAPLIFIDEEALHAKAVGKEERSAAWLVDDESAEQPAHAGRKRCWGLHVGENSFVARISVRDCIAMGLASEKQRHATPLIDNRAACASFIGSPHPACVDAEFIELPQRARIEGLVRHRTRHGLQSETRMCIVNNRALACSLDDAKDPRHELTDSSGCTTWIAIRPNERLTRTAVYPSGSYAAPDEAQ